MTARTTYWRFLEWAKTRRLYGRLMRGRLIRRYFSTHSIRKLQIGSGPKLHPDWLNADLEPRSERCVFLDARRRFPFKDESFDYVFTEHMIEHTSYEEGLHVLSESYRILRPGGKIRVVTPDLEALLGLLNEPRTEVQEDYIRWMMDTHTDLPGNYNPAIVINTAVRAWGHQFIYDSATLRAALEQAGFVNVQRFSPEETDEEVFRGIEVHGLEIGSKALARYEAFAMEAIRPGIGSAEPLAHTPAAGFVRSGRNRAVGQG
jgi:predicted SAM-dependent methyltransferase